MKTSPSDILAEAGTWTVLCDDAVPLWGDSGVQFLQVGDIVYVCAAVLKTLAGVYVNVYVNVRVVGVGSGQIADGHFFDVQKMLRLSAGDEHRATQRAAGKWPRT